ncbi:hypothetical protein [Streptoalloteichus hindustanus]|uniref:Peptidase inhibitor family I36 n=1 Tax=Streptoalloteichus hindustanus TaxID=2017 RepID=A0A1M5J4W1_STRHI|nr:hypothetical protein [Streptoalloteichus hindustanus]SHG35349.1 hypothetical protein SAMN05444320_108127 [Streptoalloteichus hindustanus]
MVRKVLTAVTVGLTALSFAPAAVAAPSEAVTEYCAVIVSKERDEHGFSKELAKSCSPVSVEDALVKASASGGGRFSVPELAGTLLLNQFKDVNYGGGVIHTYYGGGGPCDTMGYYLRNTVSVSKNVSSMIGYNNCNRVRVHDWDENSYQFDLPVAHMGRFNDNVNGLRVFHM